MKIATLFLSMALIYVHVQGQNPIQISYCDFDVDAINCEFLMDTSSQNLWQIGTPQKPFFGNAWSAPNAIQTDTINSYPVNNYSVFTMKLNNNVVDATDWALTTLSFWHKYQTDFMKDFGKISFSMDNGNTWLPMIDTFGVQGTNGYYYEWFSWNMPLMETFDPSLEENVLTGISSDWIFSQYSWLWYLPVEAVRDFTPDSLLFKFVFTSDDIFDNYDGWIIDQISVEKTALSGIHDPEKLSTDLHVYPNPASEDISYAFSGDEIPQTLQFINQQGIVVRQQDCSAKQGKISLSKLPNGNYFLQLITTSGNIAVQKIAVN